jgi:hypothetical protein
VEVRFRGPAVPCGGVDARGVARAGDDVAGVGAAGGCAARGGGVGEDTAAQGGEEAGYCEAKDGWLAKYSHRHNATSSYLIAIHHNLHRTKNPSRNREN